MSVESDYEQIPGLNNRISSDYATVEELNLGQTRRQESNKVEDIYARVDLSKKSPKKEKVETEKERNERIQLWKY